MRIAGINLEIRMNVTLIRQRRKRFIRFVRRINRSADQKEVDIKSSETNIITNPSFVAPGWEVNWNSGAERPNR
jgi:hypothetical protein